LVGPKPARGERAAVMALSYGSKGRWCTRQHSMGSAKPCSYASSIRPPCLTIHDGAKDKDIALREEGEKRTDL